MSEEDKLARFDKMIIALIVVFLLMIIAFFSVNYFSDYVKTAVKGYVKGAVVWSNAQKEASYHLKNYVYNQKKSDYQQYKKPLEIIKGDRQAALTLISDNPDYEKARQGFIKANITVEHIDAMIWLVTNFKNYELFVQAIEIWKTADKQIQELTKLAEELHHDISNGSLTPEEQNQFSNRIDELNASLTTTVQSYVDVMTETERLVGNVTFWVNAIVAVLLMFSGGVIAVGFIYRAKQWNKTLSQSETKFRHVLDNTRDVIYEMNLDSGKFEYISPTVKNQLGYSHNELYGEGIKYLLALIHPEDREKIRSINRKYEENNIEEAEKEFECRMKTKNGDYIWVSNKHSIVRNAAGKSPTIVGNVRDITQRKKSEEKLNHMLAEKVTLLEEIHHRVKNNLAIISGLLELQKEGLDSEVKGIFEESQSRIQSMALVHERLYKSEKLSEISMKEYISELTDAIKTTHEVDSQDITIKKEIEEIYLDLEKVIPVGLILNELITNAFKHAFSNGNEDVIKILLKKTGANLTIMVADNGKGLPADFEIHSSKTLGMSLVSILTKQIEGDLKVSSNGWTKFKITF
jgi:PAS domain S-box-containing protein